MSAVAGPLRRVSIDGRSFSPAGSEPPKRVLGGPQISEIEANTDNTVRVITEFVPAQYSDVVLTLDDSQQDLEFLKSVQERNALGEAVPCAFTEASNITYRGGYYIVGPVERDSGKATTTLTFKGGSQSQ